jgi:hypothetical protein
MFAPERPKSSAMHTAGREKSWWNLQVFQTGSVHNVTRPGRHYICGLFSTSTLWLGVHFRHARQHANITSTARSRLDTSNPDHHVLKTCYNSCDTGLDLLTLFWPPTIPQLSGTARQTRAKNTCELYQLICNSM